MPRETAAALLVEGEPPDPALTTAAMTDTVARLTESLAELAKVGGALLVEQAQVIRRLRADNAALRREIDQVTEREREGRSERA